MFAYMLFSQKKKEVLKASDQSYDTLSDTVENVFQYFAKII